MTEEQYNQLMASCTGLAGNIPYVGGAIAFLGAAQYGSKPSASWDEITEYVEKYVEDQLFADHLKTITNSIDSIYSDLENYQTEVDGDAYGPTLWSLILNIQTKVDNILYDLLDKQGFENHSNDGIWFSVPWESVDAAQQLLLLGFTVANEMVLVAQMRVDSIDEKYSVTASEKDQKTATDYLNARVNAYRNAIEKSDLCGLSHKDRMSRIILSKDYMDTEYKDTYTKESYAVKWSDSFNTEKKGDFFTTNQIYPIVGQSNKNASTERRDHRNFYLDWVNETDAQAGVDIRQKIIDPFNVLITREGINNATPVTFIKPFAKPKNFNVIINECSSSLVPKTSVVYRSLSDGYDTAEFFEIGKESYLFLLKSGNGRMHIYRMNDNGTLGPLIDNQSWSNGYKVSRFFATEDGHNCLFRLKPDSGTAQVNRMNADGSVGEQIMSENLGKGWTSAEFFMSTDSNGRNAKQNVFLTNKKEGKWKARVLNPDGSVNMERYQDGKIGSDICVVETVNGGAADSVYLCRKDGMSFQYVMKDGYYQMDQPTNIEMSSGNTISDRNGRRLYLMNPKTGKWSVYDVSKNGTPTNGEAGENEISIKDYNMVRFFNSTGNGRKFQLSVRKTGKYANIGV